MLKVIGHVPTVNATGVYRDQVVSVEFNKAIESSSVDYRVMSVHDEFYTTLPGTVGIDWIDQGTSSGYIGKVIFTPSVTMNPDAKYTVYLHKTPNAVIATDGDQFEDTYRFSFWTGTSNSDTGPSPTAYEQLLIDLQAAIDAEDWALAAQIQSLIDTYGSGYTPSFTTPSDDPVELAITSTNPLNEEPNVELSLRHIKISFNDIPYTSGIAMSDFVSVAYQNVLV